jgi:hypothetical protein
MKPKTEQEILGKKKSVNTFITGTHAPRRRSVAEEKFVTQMPALMKNPGHCRKNVLLWRERESDPAIKCLLSATETLHLLLQHVTSSGRCCGVSRG